MLVLRGHVLEGTPAPVSTPTVLTLGNFDGVHLGHRAMLARLRAEADARGFAAAVLTFEPHPRDFFARQQQVGAPARLSVVREKLEMLAETGVDLTCICRFTPRFAALSAEAFVTEVLVRRLRVRHVIVGDDFRFGAGRTGDFALLQAMGEQAGFTVEAMHSVLLDGQADGRAGERVSSSAIRRALAAGDMAHAARLLGRPYTIDGRVVHGDKLARQWGFATANIRIKHNPLPLAGVFAVRVNGIAGVALPGVANLGIRPTVGGLRTLLEVHLFDFTGDIYGKHLCVHFEHKLRNEQKFPDFAALKAQIARDAAAARAFFQC